MKIKDKEQVTAEDMINKLGLEKPNSFLDSVVWRVIFTIIMLTSLNLMSVLIFPHAFIPVATFNVGWFGQLWWQWYRKA